MEIKNFLGMPEDKALILAKLAGLNARVNKRDGILVPINVLFLYPIIKFNIKDGIVVEAYEW